MVLLSFPDQKRKELFKKSVIVGIIVSIMIGIPFLLIIANSGEEIPIWFGLIYIILIMPVITYITYMTACKKQKN